jgi:hypothetical protein
MSDWADKLVIFLEPWRQMPELVGVLVCGSYVTGSPSAHSDLDVHLILSEATEWRERGNVVIEGLVIEYFANPPRQIRKYFAEDHAAGARMAVTQFLTGKVLVDTAGHVALLREEARTWAEKPLPVPPAWKTELDKYALWDMADNLRDAAERQAPDVPFLYHVSLQRLFQVYARHAGWAMPGVEKLHGCLTSARVRAKYLQPECPARDLAAAFAAALAIADPAQMPARYEELTRMVLETLGGFDLNGWKLRSPVE